MSRLGTCDLCDAQKVRVRCVEVTGLEAYACAKCCNDPPRRCETNECDLNGECIACGAFSGEICLDDE